ncbi:putative hmg box protein [Erysiphe neolycopersici]|uniref:Putative hmg box protein n=1 Tax=Erysiphe neolycopersici TaxID=212602 RepID=A0A420HVM9_9PEZI|nr:putative hmg box protein [Erysiphe neolycopersici]
MLLSSIGRSSLERVLSLNTSSTSSALHGIIHIPRIRIAIFYRDVSASFFSTYLSKRQYTASRTATSKSRSNPSATKLALKATKSSATKVANKSPKGKQLKEKPSKTLTKKPKKARKVLSSQEKLAIKTMTLKAQALRPPKKLPSSARTTYMAKNLKGTSGDEITSRFTEVSQAWKNITQHEREEYESLARANRDKNEKVLTEWLSNYTPDQIRTANNARRQISKMDEVKKYWKKIQDPRLPKQPSTRFTIFTQERFKSGDFKGVDVLDATKQLVKEYFALSPVERKKYHDKFLQSRNQYIKDHIAAFNREPKCATKKVN